ncbi:hypothetical protein I0C86_08225 [Plantactinospora sp. S1510]|uniref:Excreted virulence factor EspC (Type VII ESX diderm) n=1 Tax=Plantactinospora alkalitolerans TaxID=2789879 RepID=A0ABS0GSD1_9ACTN|nr:type VII secretion target [Plantactinospora alkalitolerans]MBF9128969.1 hypothetical protein [Plantactinospora alkalitolerans]
MTHSGFEVDCRALETAARAATTIARDIGMARRQFQAAADGVRTGAPGSASAAAAAQLSGGWGHWLDSLRQAAEEFSRRLDQAGENYCATDLGAAGKVGGAAGRSPGGGSGKGPSGIPGVPGGGYVGPHSVGG